MVQVIRRFPKSRISKIKTSLYSHFFISQIAFEVATFVYS